MVGPGQDHGRGPASDALPAWLWLWLPLVCLVVPFVAGFAAPAFYDRVFETEFGLVENVQAMFLLLAFVWGLRGFRLARLQGLGWQSIWLGLFTVACVLFFGEEVSWGQHWVGWEAEGVFAERGQQETNLHNIHPALSRAPRAIVVSGILIAGAILPLTPLGHWAAGRLPGPAGFWTWALPSRACGLTAILVLGVKLPKRLLRWTGLEDAHWPGLNDNELLEVFVAYFFLLYALLLWRRLSLSASATARP